MPMSDEDIKREAVKKIFRDPSKVDKMSNEQVTAIYLRLKAQGRL